MNDDLYRFEIVDGEVLGLFEFDDGIWEDEPFDANEEASYDPVTGNVTVTERYADYLEIKVYVPTVLGGTDYLLDSKSYTDLSGVPITDEPGDDDESEDEDGDGIDDDDLDEDGFDDDDIDGSDDDDVVDARDGDDSVDGAGGDDELDGGLGEDSLDGGSGSDDLDGQGDDDDLSGGDGNDTLRGGSGSDDLTGGTGDDSLEGGSGGDRCWGGEGSDDIRGGGGNDTIAGGGDAGDDDYIGGLGIDEVDYADAAAAVTASLAAGLASSSDGVDGAGIGSDTLLGIEALGGSRFDDRLTGNAGRNVLEGGHGADTMRGGAGSDVLHGGRGADRLDGGDDDARDVFDFDHIADSRVGAMDRIVRFEGGIDDLDLRTIDANTALDGNQAFVFGGAEATANGVWATLVGGSTVLFGDVDGDAQADFAILLVGVTGIAAPDVLL